MERTLGSDIENPIARRQFLTDNCDAVVDKGYMKPYSPEELQGHKESLATIREIRHQQSRQGMDTRLTRLVLQNEPHVLS